MGEAQGHGVRAELAKICDGAPVFRRPANMWLSFFSEPWYHGLRRLPGGYTGAPRADKNAAALGAEICLDLCNINDIRQLLGRHGFRFSKAMGQNFLTAGWVPERIAEESKADGDCGVLEIGPGVGCLTAELAPRAGRVVSVELDRRLIPVLEETLSDFENVELVQGDILKLDIEKLVSSFDGLRPVVCANLPYNITSPVLAKIIDSGLFERITVMVQREFARRVCAKAGESDYGAFTLYVNYHTEPELLFDVPPGCFMPQPKVTSTVVSLNRRSEPPVAADREMLFRVIKASFAHRRKTLVNGLCSAFGSRLTKEELATVVLSCGHDEQIRGETLDLEGFAAVTLELTAALEQKGG